MRLTPMAPIHLNAHGPCCTGQHPQLKMLMYSIVLPSAIALHTKVASQNRSWPGAYEAVARNSRIEHPIVYQRPSACKGLPDSLHRHR